MRIVVIGNFNMVYNSHVATNRALEHLEHYFNTAINVYWISEREAAAEIDRIHEQFDAAVLTHGPIESKLLMRRVFSQLLRSGTPILATGESAAMILGQQIRAAGFDPEDSEVMSDNLVEGDVFEHVFLEKVDPELSRKYNGRRMSELTSDRYWIDRHVLEAIRARGVEVLANNQFDEPTVFSLNEYPCCIGVVSCPQVSSSESIPHPLLIWFLEKCFQRVDT